MRTDKAAVLIKKAALVIDKKANQVLAPFDLINTQYKIMKYLYANQNMPVRQADIEAKFSTTNPTVTGIMQNLEKKSFSIRAENPADKRSKLLVLTVQGLEMKEKTVSRWGNHRKTANCQSDRGRMRPTCVLATKNAGEEVIWARN